MSALYDVTVQGIIHGEVFKKSGRWRWYKKTRGIEAYHRKATLRTVREHIARLCLVPIGEVRLHKKPWETP